MTAEAERGSQSAGHGTTISRRGLLRGVAVLGGLAVASPGGPLTPHVAAAAGHPAALARRHGPDVLLDWLDVVYDAVRTERASPPSAARIYGAMAVAAHEAVVAGTPGRRSLAGQLDGLDRIPAPIARGTLDWRAAVNVAVATTMAQAFADRAETTRSALASHAAAVHDVLARETGGAASRGRQHGVVVGKTVAGWLASDGYAASRGLPYTPPTGPGAWVPTPPNRGAAIEPHWERVRPIALADGAECAPPPPVAFDETPGSPFHEQAMVVVRAASSLTDAQRDTAMYWRDNPDGSTGLPSGHWMQIAAGAARGHDLADAAELLALVGIVLADSFTSCWVEKYRTNLLRPVTYINRVIDPTWASVVNSPAFPEYTSGHSVGSGGAARALTRLVGAVPFVDDAAAGRGFAPRRYSSYEAAAAEAAVSRLYGGIHYPMAIDVGLVQGVHVADTVLDRLRTRR